MSLRQRASNYALLTIDETPTPPRGANGSIASAAGNTSSPAKYPTPLTGNWADYAAWSPNHEHRDAAGDAPSDTSSDDPHNISHENSVDEASPQTRHITLPQQTEPVYHNPYTSYHAMQYPTTPYGAPVPPEYQVDANAFEAPPPPVYQSYPMNYQMCTCGCGQRIPAEYPTQDPAYNTVPWGSEGSVESDPTSEPAPAFVPRFGPPPPPPVKMAQLLTEHGNANGDAVRYNAVLRWYERIERDAPHFAPDVTRLPVISAQDSFDKTVIAVNEWWKKNFGERQSHQSSRAASRSQPVQPIRSANLGQYMSYPMYDRSTISTRRHHS